MSEPQKTELDLELEFLPGMRAKEDSNKKKYDHIRGDEEARPVAARVRVGILATAETAAINAVPGVPDHGTAIATGTAIAAKGDAISVEEVVATNVDVRAKAGDAATIVVIANPNNCPRWKSASVPSPTVWMPWPARSGCPDERIPSLTSPVW